MHPLLVRLLRRAYHGGHARLHEMTQEEIQNHLAQFNTKGKEEVDLPFESYEINEEVRFEIIRKPAHHNDQKGTLLFIRGSAFTGGPLDETLSYTHMLADYYGMDVVNLHFRVAPQYKFPTFFEDICATVQYLADNHTQYHLNRPFTLWGESSGGTMAASVCQHFENMGKKLIDKLVLIYPMMDLIRDYPSKDLYGQGYMLDLTFIEWLKDKTLNTQEEWSDYRISPALGTMSTMPPTFVVTAEFDPLRDEAETYVETLKNLGNTVHHKRAEGMIHAFFRYYDKLEQTQACLAWLKESL